MGYSERYCHICGVSFNIGRIRTKNEPRSLAWRGLRSQVTPTFVDGGRNSHIGECGRDAGCMLAFREDMEKEVRERERKYDERIGATGHGYDDASETKADRDDDDDENDEDFVPDQMIMDKLRIDEAFDTKDAALALQKLISSTQSHYEFARVGEMSSDIQFDDHGLSGNDPAVGPMDYEFDSPSETCSEFEGVNREDPMTLTSDNEDEAETRYQEFVKTLKHEDGPKAAQDHEELLLPLFRPLIGRDADLASTHGSNASFEMEESQDPDDGGQELDHWICGKLSHYKHPLNKSVRHHRDCIWEHIAGPGCVNNCGYGGTRISEVEMRFANTLQCLVRKTDVSTDDEKQSTRATLSWQPEWDDEPWEQSALWFISGVSDHMPSRDWDDPEVFPPRHGSRRPNAENVCWRPHDDDPDRRYAMPFHPSCMEIYKRASIVRHGTFNVDLLGSWWQLKSRYDVFRDFPRSEAVKRGEGQWWKHNPGDEHLAADPLWPRGLESAIASAKLGQSFTRTTKPVSLEWISLPLEITAQILEYLDTVSIAAVSLAIPETRSIARKLIQGRLKTRYPCLWELGSTQPYYKWTGLTARELKIRQEELDRREVEFQSVCEILEEEDYNSACNQLKRSWAESSEVRKREVFGSVMVGKPTLQVPTDAVGIAKFAIALHDAAESDDLKGLQNRERIWKDCEAILSQIEELQRQGEILQNGQPRPGAQLTETRY